MWLFMDEIPGEFRNTTLSEDSQHSTPGNWSFQDVLDNIDIGILIVDVSRQSVDFSNPVALDILQTPQRQLSFTSLIEYLMRGTGYRALHELNHATHTVQRGSKLLGYSIYPISDCHYCILIRDITEKTRLESIAQAVNTMDNIGFIFSGIRHEIGNPLNSIKMTISVLRKNLDSFSRDAIREYIERTADEVTRMEYLLKSLKNFSMFEKLDNRPNDLGLFLEKFLDLVSRDFVNKGLELSCAPLPYGVLTQTDSRALHQALLNVLANAADALENRPRPQIKIRTRANGALAWIKIEDNGCGMSELQQQQLFQPFTTSKAKGNGLGLVITQKLLAKMNASIDIHSAEGIGTVVRIALPLAGRLTDEERRPHTEVAQVTVENQAS